MEKLEAQKVEEKDRLAKVVGSSQAEHDVVVPLKSYQDLLAALVVLTDRPEAVVAKGKVIQTLVKRIEVTSEGFKLQFQVGKSYFEGELSTNPLFQKKSGSLGSKSLKNGWRDRD